MLEETQNVIVPLDVPFESRDIYVRNYLIATRQSGRLMLFAGDQKVEHLNDDFLGPGIHPDDGDPEHLFRVASKGNIGVFASHLGLIARYGMDYPAIPYIIKLNGKTNLIPATEKDPLSPQWIDIEQVISFVDRSKLTVVGVGYTIYPGSDYEATMLREAAQIIYRAHDYGLITVLWVYPRGKNVKDEKDPHLIAGAAGLAASLGSDFVKVNYPKHGPISPAESPAEALKEAVRAAGRTKVLCAGGPAIEVKAFFQSLYNQIHVGGAAGSATGRNIHQKSLKEAIRMCNAIYAIVVENKDANDAYKIFQKS